MPFEHERPAYPSGRLLLASPASAWILDLASGQTHAVGSVRPIWGAAWGPNLQTAAFGLRRDGRVFIDVLDIESGSTQSSFLMPEMVTDAEFLAWHEDLIACVVSTANERGSRLLVWQIGSQSFAISPFRDVQASQLSWIGGDDKHELYFLSRKIDGESPQIWVTRTSFLDAGKEFVGTEELFPLPARSRLVDVWRHGSRLLFAVEDPDGLIRYGALGSSLESFPHSLGPLAGIRHPSDYEEALSLIAVGLADFHVKTSVYLIDLETHQAEEIGSIPITYVHYMDYLP